MPGMENAVQLSLAIVRHYRSAGARLAALGVGCAAAI
jgi:hypothetical protein